MKLNKFTSRNTLLRDHFTFSETHNADLCLGIIQMQKSFLLIYKITAYRTYLYQCWHENNVCESWRGVTIQI